MTPMTMGIHDEMVRFYGCRDTPIGQRDGDPFVALHVSDVGRTTPDSLPVVGRDAIHADTVRRALQFFRVTLEPKSS